MNLQLFKNTSENNKINKVINFINQISGYLRTPTTILNPVIDIELADYKSLETLIDVVYTEFIYPLTQYDLSYADGEEDIDVDTYTENISIFKINYAYIDEFERYYYVKNVECINNKLFRLYLAVDVLMSYKEQFTMLDAVIERSSYNYDNYIEDTQLPFKYDKNITKQYLNYSFSFNPYLKSGFNFAITFLERDGSYANQAEIISPVSYLPNISYDTFGLLGPLKTLFTNTDDAYSVLKYVLEHSDKSGFVISAVCLPYNIPINMFTQLQFKLDNTAIPGAYGYFGSGETGSLSNYILIGSFNESILDVKLNFTDYTPYSRYELYIPYYGFVELDYIDIKASEIRIYMNINYQSGEAKINICNHTKGYVIKSVNAIIGIKIPVNRTNQQQLEDEKTQLMIKTAISTLGSLIAIGGGSASGNGYMVASGLMGLVSTTGDVVSKLATMHTMAQTSNTSGFDGLYGEQYCYLKITKMVSVEPTNYEKYYGKPVIKTYRISDFRLNDYIKVSDIHLENIDALEDEKALIENLLKSGVIL